MDPASARLGVRPRRNDRGVPNYTYRAQWSSRHGEYLGRCAEFPGETSRAPTAQAAVAAVEGLVDAAIAELAKEDIRPPKSLTETVYSGTFIIRTSPELHARLMLEAAEQGVSFNHWAAQRLANRQPSFDDLF